MGEGAPKQDWKLWYDKWLAETCALQRENEGPQAKIDELECELDERKVTALSDVIELKRLLRLAMAGPDEKATAEIEQVLKE